MGGGGSSRRTISLDDSPSTFDNHAQFRPFGKVFEVEADIIGFCQVI